jgi:hypothetical protein
VLCASAFGQVGSTRSCPATRGVAFPIEPSPKVDGADRRDLAARSSNGCHDRAGGKRRRREGVEGRGEQSLPLLSGIDNRRGWSSLTSRLPARPVGCVLGICACPVCVPSPEDTGRPASRRTGGACFSCVRLSGDCRRIDRPNHDNRQFIVVYRWGASGRAAVVEPVNT